MSEYQYYESLAVDRPLTAAEVAVTRRVHENPVQGFCLGLEVGATDRREGHGRGL
jgi:hypothetical protein